MELIKIENVNGENLVLAKNLWEFLEKPYGQFNKWFEKMKEYDFEKDVDFTSFGQKNPKGGRPTVEYLLKLDMAKELSMLARSEKGKQARKYFIECEKKLSLKAPSTLKEALMLALEQQEKIEQLESKNKVQEQILLEYEPKIEYVDTILNDNSSTLTITQIAKDYGLSGSGLNKILNDKKVQYKQSGTWLLYSNHANKGYTKSTTTMQNDKPRLHTKWTQKGRLFIHELLKKSNILALQDKEA